MADTKYEKIQKIREEAGFQEIHLAEEASGTVNGANKSFTVAHKPLVDRTYSDDVTKDDVVVYVDDVPVTVSSVNATAGSVTLADAPATDSVVTVDYASSPVSDTYISDTLEEVQAVINQKISDVTTTPLSTVPAQIRLATRLFVAGLILTKEYGFQDDTEGTNKDGNAKIKQAEKIIADYHDLLATTTVKTKPSSKNDGMVFSRTDSEGKIRPLDDDSSVEFYD